MVKKMKNSIRLLKKTEKKKHISQEARKKCADWISFVKINTSPFDISLNISVWSAELWNASRQLTFPFLPQSISLNSTLSYFRSQDSQLFLFPQSNKTEKPFTITGKILKSSFFKCIGYCKGENVWRGFVWACGAEDEGRINKCSQTQRDLCVYTRYNNSPFFSRIYTVVPDVSQQFGFVFFFLYLLPQRKKKLKKKDHKKREKNSSFLVSDWATMKQQLGLLWGAKLCVCKNNIFC